MNTAGLSTAKDFYNAHLAFALKLGYSETQVQKALQKLGTSVTQNEFLAELIKLGSTVTETESGSSLTSRNSDSVGLSTRNSTVSGLQGDLSRVSDTSSQLRHVVVDGSNVAMW